MECPQCGYVFSAFDKECPWCARFGGARRPEPTPVPPAQPNWTPPPPSDHYPPPQGYPPPGYPPHGYPPHGYPPQGQYGYPPPDPYPRRTMDVCAILSLVFGSLGLLSFCCILGSPANLIALVLGGVSISRINSDPNLDGKAMAIAGMVLGLLGLLGAIAWFGFGVLGSFL